VALYSAWRRLTTKVVSQITGSAAPLPIRLTAMNCDEPANTSADSASVAHAGMPLAIASVPKMTPNGAAPTSIGSESRAPASSGGNRCDMLAPQQKVGRIVGRRQRRRLERSCAG
jgi:hypothetical protein